MSNETKIEPALSSEEWADPEHRLARGGFWYYEPGGMGPCFGGSDRTGVLLPEEMIAPAIAVLNNRLRDDDPRKITPLVVARLRGLRAAFEPDDTVHGWLAPLADALASYLPPETS